MKVAYLGPEKTFTEKAATAMFKNDVWSPDLIPIQPIRKVVRAVEQGAVDFGVVPIENFYNGDVRETLDSLLECKHARIRREKAISVVLCLGALKGHEEIKHILSKDQALEQSSRYLCEKYPDAATIAMPSTAEAAQQISRQKQLDSAAIAPKQALIAAGLEVLAEDICPNNSTRFVALGITTQPRELGKYKTFIAVHPSRKDKPGLLNAITGFFSGLDINLEYIQSRPDGKKGYIFYMELDGHEEDRHVRAALDGIKLSLDPENTHPGTVKVLGSYPDTNWKGQ